MNKPASPLNLMNATVFFSLFDVFLPIMTKKTLDEVKCIRQCTIELLESAGFPPENCLSPVVGPLWQVQRRPTMFFFFSAKS